MPELRITVRSDEPIPPDVLVEHIAVALRDFKFAGKVDVQMTSPFANPSNVAFDDDVQLEPYTGPHADDDLPADPYPFVTRWLDQLRGRRRDG